MRDSVRRRGAMRRLPGAAGWSGLLLAATIPALAEGPRPMRLVETPAVSPDGARIAFGWAGEIWSAAVDGSDLRRLTSHQAEESEPLFSPDGTRIAFVSDRTGSRQVFVMRADGSEIEQVTRHTAGYRLADWFPDGRSLLAIGARDHFWREADRMIRVDLTRRRGEVVLADCAAAEAKLSPDGTKVLFVREGERWWRKGYRGERAAQVWQLTLATGEFTELLHEGVDCRWPTWMPDGLGFYFTKGDRDGFDLWRYRFAAGDRPAEQARVAGFEDDSIVFPALARSGRTVVFRHLFDLYRLDPEGGMPPVRIDLAVDGDADLPEPTLRRTFDKANEVAFTADGLEVAFLAGGDVWVMDTKLREPVRVTATDAYEDDVRFSPDGKAILFTSVRDGQVDLFRVTRADESRYWWQTSDFRLEQLTHTPHVESNPRFTPDGKTLLFIQARGDLVALNLADRTRRTLVESFSGVDFDVAPDGRWVAYAAEDEDFNREIWLTRLDELTRPVNVSRHPDTDGDPTFSPDGRLLAFTGRRADDEVDIHYVYLRADEDEKTSRQRKIEEALETMAKKRKPDGPARPTAGPDATKDVGPDGPPEDDKGGAPPDDAKEAAKPEPSKAESAGPIAIDLEDIHERVRAISIAGSSERDLVFSPDGKKLAFTATVAGKEGLHTVEFPEKLTPTFLSASLGSQAVWPKQAGAILYLQDGLPARLDPAGKLERYGFTVAQALSRAGRLAAALDVAWLTMREHWYDERFSGRNWDAVRRKYLAVAADLHDEAGLAAAVELMLGELNGSHLGFTPRRDRPPRPASWTEETAHLGVRFVAGHRGPGLLVRDVLPGGPGDRRESRLLAGDVIRTIDGVAVDPDLDPTTVLNGRLDRDVVLTVERKADPKSGPEADAKELTVTLRPISYAAARTLLYEHWLRHNRRLVETISGGKLGYLHIRSMDMKSFYEFERQLYHVGYGREGLVIDVRDNGGGSTTDLLLTALTQPRHAITVPHGGAPGYPQDRTVFASWSKPIVVLCNQNSYSNAEIFSHAIKTLGRGKLVGVTTAGGVVSTGAAPVLDAGQIRVPYRGWFVIGTGEDMELGGAVPDVAIWPRPGELPAGVDRQLEKAVELLMKDVADRPPARPLRYASERDAG